MGQGLFMQVALRPEPCRPGFRVSRAYEGQTVSGPGVASFHLKLRGGRWALRSDAQAFHPFPFGIQSNHLEGPASDHPFGDSEEARFKTTRSEVDSPGAPAFNKAGGARAWPDTTTADAIQGMREGLSRSARDGAGRRFTFFVIPSAAPQTQKK